MKRPRHGSEYASRKEELRRWVLGVAILGWVVAVIIGGLWYIYELL